MLLSGGLKAGLALSFAKSPSVYFQHRSVGHSEPCYKLSSRAALKGTERQPEVLSVFSPAVAQKKWFPGPSVA